MNIAKIMVLMAMLLVATSFASAQNLEIQYVKINGEEFDSSTVGVHDTNLEVRRGEDLDLKIRVKALSNVDDVQIEADIYGYKYSHKEEALISDTSRTFDMSVGDVKTIDLRVSIPWRMDKKYTLLRIRVADEDGTSYEQVYQLHVVGVEEDDAVIIRDVTFNPSSNVAAGRAFTTMVRLQNIGDDDLDDIKVTVDVPDLNVKDSVYLDELLADEKETLEDFLIRVPSCTVPGVYNVKVTVEFDEFSSTSTTEQITVLAGGSCYAAGTPSDDEETFITVPEQQEVRAGKEVAYPMMISNRGSVAKTYSLAVAGISGWGVYSFEPSSVLVIGAGEVKTVYLYIDTENDASGEKVFMVTVAAEGESQSFPLTADVVKSGASLKGGLEVALVVLVIILIIVGLVIGFTKLRRKEDDGDTQTYY